MALGKVKKWLADKGIGWISGDDGTEYFFGDRSLRGLEASEIKAGLAVEFKPTSSNRGPAAHDVRRPGTEVSSSPPPKHSKRPGPKRPPRDKRPDAPGEVPVPRSVQELLKQVPDGEKHVGLSLDKFIRPPSEQKHQKEILDHIARLPGDSIVLSEAFGRWNDLVSSFQEQPWQRTTVTPLTLHLSRASALENAGICLHPLYGFAYLPGSGLKGMARAYAETIWLPSLSMQEQGPAWEKIERVFGWGPNSDSIGGGVSKPWKPDAAKPRGGSDRAASGEIIFFDSMPSNWPRLYVNIVNNHHPAYYQGTNAPGDWDSPNPVNFLAVTANQTFSFAVAKRRADAPDESRELAEKWLDGALSHLGCGAKTAAGYGYFSSEEKPTSEKEQRIQLAVDLELTSPAFLAGANQLGPRAADGCDLRSATLRGSLRWWWRTMHSGYLSRSQLAALEAAIWGDTEAGGAVQTIVEPIHKVGPSAFDYKDRYSIKADFQRRHNFADPPDGKTTPGLFYVAYGMNEKSGPRYYLDAGSKWRVRLVVRPTMFFAERADAKAPHKRGSGQSIEPETVLLQARAALSLLCSLGGVGSKTRKGFGSLQTVGSEPQMDTEQCKNAASELRKSLGLNDEFQEELAESSSLGNAILTLGIAAPSKDPWFVLHEIGFAYQSFAQRFKHNQDREGELVPVWTGELSTGYTKASLGLPRKIHGPLKEPMRNQDRNNWQPSVPLDFPGRDPSIKPQDARYASPLHFHLGKSSDDGLNIQLCAFPAKNLPTLESSKKFLETFIEQFKREIDRSPKSSASPTPATPARSAQTGKRAFGTSVTVKIVSVRMRKKRGEELPGGYFVQEAGKPQGILALGTIPDPPPDIDSEVQVYVKDDNPDTPQYTWDAPKPQTSGKGGKGKR